MASVRVSALCLACACTSEPVIPLPDGEIQLAVTLDDAHATGRLIGWNLGRGTLYATANDTIHPEWRSPERIAAFARLSSLRNADDAPPYVRFSGLQIDGALGQDGYHFWRYADPARVVADDDNMAPYQHQTIVDEVDGTPLVTVDFGSGTADEAARYLKHLVASDGSDEANARAHWGHPDPWPTSIYEIGNEVYGPWNTGYTATGNHAYANPDAEGGGDPAWHGRPSAAAADYAARALAYADAMSAVQPDARFWVPLAQSSMDAWGGLDAALADLDPLLRDERITAVVVHHYQVDDLAPFGANDKTALELALAGSEVLAPGYRELRERIAAIPRATPLQIAITEYHVAGAFTFGAFDPLADTHVVGLGVADALLSFAELGIDHAAQHLAIAFDEASQSEALFEPWYNPLRVVNGEVQPRPSLVATELVAQHLRRDTAHVEAIDVPQGHYEDGAFALDYPLVRTVAFADDESATVLVLHRDLAESHTLTIDLPKDDWQLAAAQIYAPQDLTTPIGDAAIALADADVELRGDRIAFALPPHSLLAIVLAR
ncbi:MAG TPA: hypothetical protein VG755_09695 [Nannocystaceae bacterium]|nr:hypothetical protein [Nannocystaceae bacterium]